MTSFAIQLLDIVAMAVKLKVAEKRCTDIHDYFRLVQRVSGLLETTTSIAAQKETEIVNFLEDSVETANGVSPRDRNRSWGNFLPLV